jgi:hypothetical protein
MPSVPISAATPFVPNDDSHVPGIFYKINMS